MRPMRSTRNGRRAGDRPWGVMPVMSTSRAVHTISRLWGRPSSAFSRPPTARTRQPGSSGAMDSWKPFAPTRPSTGSCRNNSTGTPVHKLQRGIWPGATLPSFRAGPPGDLLDTMTTGSQEGSTEEETAATGAEEVRAAGLRSQVRMMLRALRASPVAKTLLFLVVLIIVVVVVTSYGQIRLNRWNKPFFDALSRRDLRDFLAQLGVFFIIAGLLLVLNVWQRWLVEMLKLKLRQGLVRDLLKDWMLPRRAFWLANAGGPMGVNPDQRMHEDARKLCELSADLGTGCCRPASCSGSSPACCGYCRPTSRSGSAAPTISIPGFMLWAAIVYAGAGSLLSYWVGRSLISRNSERYAREADLRFSLVRINEHLDGISLAAGEEDERRRVELHLGNVLAATRRLVKGLTNLTWVTAGFGWITIVAPILVAAPLYFAGKISSAD